MTRFLLTLLSGLAFFMGVAHARSPGSAIVTAELASDGIHAAVVLDRAITHFAFADADVIREGDFELLTPGLTLKNDVITASQPFRRFNLRIKPMTQERDAKYPAHYRVGAGGVLYAPALKANPAEWRTRLLFKTAPGHIRAPSSGSVDDGFVFLGPAALRTEYKGIVTIADPQTPPWLLERTRADLAAAVLAFTAAIDAPLPRRPLLIVKHEDGASNSQVGDVTPGAVTALRFHGGAWAKPDKTTAKSIQGLILHEAFHFWNGGLARHAQDAPTWLHEGGAEYASLLGGLKAGVLDDEDVRERLSEALRRCRFGLQGAGDKGMADIPFLSNQIRYPCGMVLQWAADLHLRAASGGTRSIMNAWADVIRIARRRSSTAYNLADFYAAARIENTDAFLPAALLVNRSGSERWNALPMALNELGAEVAQVPSPEGRRGKLLFHLLTQNCRDLPKGTGIGFFAEAQTIKLDSPDGCGALAGNPVLKSVEGGDPFDMTPETYLAVQRKCARKQEVALMSADGRTLSAVCAKPLAAAPEDYVVRRWIPQPHAPS